MEANPFRDLVTAEPELRALIGTPGPIAVAKEGSQLDGHCRRFIAHSPYVLIGTSDAAGRCDVSPKGDAPGFVLVLDDTHLVIPDRPGNKRLDGMRNILVRPHIGLLFLVPGREETLRVNGRAWLTRDDDLLERTSASGKRPTIAIGVEVEEVFTHCGKASLRSSLWQPDRWPDLSDLPSAACILHDRVHLDDMTLEQMEQRIVDDKNRLY
jgi:uncharacterized protein